MSFDYLHHQGQQQLLWAGDRLHSARRRRRARRPLWWGIQRGSRARPPSPRGIPRAGQTQLVLLTTLSPLPSHPLTLSPSQRPLPSHLARVCVHPTHVHPHAPPHPPLRCGSTSSSPHSLESSPASFSTLRAPTIMDTSAGAGCSGSSLRTRWSLSRPSSSPCSWRSRPSSARPSSPNSPCSL